MTNFQLFWERMHYSFCPYQFQIMGHVNKGSRNRQILDEHSDELKLPDDALSRKQGSRGHCTCPFTLYCVGAPEPSQPLAGACDLLPANILSAPSREASPRDLRQAARTSQSGRVAVPAFMSSDENAKVSVA